MDWGNWRIGGPDLVGIMSNSPHTSAFVGIPSHDTFFPIGMDVGRTRVVVALWVFGSI